MQRMKLETAQNVANKVQAEITSLELMRDYYRKSIEVVKKFENKVINKRFTTALNTNLNDTNARFILGGSMNAFEFRVYGTSQRGWQEDHAVYQFYSFTGGLAETRTYNRETNLNDKFVILFKKDDLNRINAEGWVELFESRADLAQSKINDRIPYTDANEILKASAEEDRLEEEIRKLNDLKSKALPYFLRR